MTTPNRSYPQRQLLDAAKEVLRCCFVLDNYQWGDRSRRWAGFKTANGVPMEMSPAKRRAVLALEQAVFEHMRD